METMILVEDEAPKVSEKPLRLGRHVRHDPRSWAYPAPMAGELKSVRHKRRVPIWNQGSLGACTGFAGVGCISSGPFTHKGNAKQAVAVYSEATRLDEFAGAYPPKDTGSSGLAVMKALRKRKLIKGYAHAFGVDHAFRALMLRPGITGFAWRTGCDRPDAAGVVRYSGPIRGGHEVVLAGLDLKKKLVMFDNSWGVGWGLRGSFAMSIADYTRALADHGDVTFPLL